MVNDTFEIDTVPEEVSELINNNDNANATYKEIEKTTAELDLVILVARTISMKIGKHEAKVFISDPLIRKLDGLSEAYKRVGIVRYINSLLFKYKAISGISVMDIIKYNELNTSTMDWYRCFHEHIVPFLKKYEVIAIVDVNNIRNSLYRNVELTDINYNKLIAITKRYTPAIK
jgi:hypothetical protein